MNRREMMTRLVLAGGAGLALPGIADAGLAAGIASGLPSAAQTGDKTTESGWKPKFLDPHQNETLIVLAERIIPGSTKAQVNRFIDLLLTVDNWDARKMFVESLSAFEAQSLRRFFHPFKDLTEVQQNEILISASTAESGHTEKDQPKRATLRDYFENMKKWVSGAYYSSEIGMKELGWTGQIYFTNFPTCQQSREKQPYTLLQNLEP